MIVNFSCFFTLDEWAICGEILDWFICVELRPLWLDSLIVRLFHDQWSRCFQTHIHVDLACVCGKKFSRFFSELPGSFENIATISSILRRVWTRRKSEFVSQPVLTITSRFFSFHVTLSSVSCFVVSSVRSMIFSVGFALLLASAVVATPWRLWNVVVVLFSSSRFQAPRSTSHAVSQLSYWWSRGKFVFSDSWRCTSIKFVTDVIYISHAHWEVTTHVFCLVQIVAQENLENPLEVSVWIHVMMMLWNTVKKSCTIGWSELDLTASYRDTDSTSRRDFCWQTFNEVLGRNFSIFCSYCEDHERHEVILRRIIWYASTLKLWLSWLLFDDISCLRWI